MYNASANLITFHDHISYLSEGTGAHEGVGAQGSRGGVGGVGAQIGRGGGGGSEGRGERAGGEGVYCMLGTGKMERVAAPSSPRNARIHRDRHVDPQTHRQTHRQPPSQAASRNHEQTYPRTYKKTNLAAARYTMGSLRVVGSLKL